MEAQTVLQETSTSAANGHKDGMQVPPQMSWTVPQNLQTHCALQGRPISVS